MPFWQEPTEKTVISEQRGARFRCDSNPSKLLKTSGRILGVISFLREFPKSPNYKSL